ncbi:hypothetical protein EVAR_8224_1 [Eumeta japonica]|uniref:Uncharacterized protein n=1 Tax=Eumeta variegata TaxID=151549 RepID=A0A4C1TGQ8_EUMVA|nr:hypothetical protein EVAR_8224_1 [Eumeta japonica]
MEGGMTLVTHSRSLLTEIRLEPAQFSELIAFVSSVVEFRERMDTARADDVCAAILNRSALAADRQSPA